MGGIDLPALLVPPQARTATLFASFNLTLLRVIAHLAPRSLAEDRSYRCCTYRRIKSVHDIVAFQRCDRGDNLGG